MQCFETSEMSEQPSLLREKPTSDGFFYEPYYVANLTRRRNQTSDSSSGYQESDDHVDEYESNDAEDFENVLSDGLEEDTAIDAGEIDNESDSTDSIVLNRTGDETTPSQPSQSTIIESINNQRRVPNTVEGRGIGSRRRKRDQNGVSGGVETDALHVIPGFSPLQHPPNKLLKHPIVRLPQELSFVQLTPSALFSLFFPADILQMIVKNTNRYASQKLRKLREQFPDIMPRKWNPISIPELKRWIAIVIYMGVHCSPAEEDYWDTESGGPCHPICGFMTLFRFQQIKRFLHITDPDSNDPGLPIFHKVLPLADHIEKMSRHVYVPSSSVSINEMMVHFSNRSGQTVRMKNKPVPEAYKIVSMCDSGYTYTFELISSLQKNPRVSLIPGINEAGAHVYHLVEKLPLDYRYNVFMDNHFSTIPLFKYLRDRNIGACGTTKSNSSLFPSSLKVRQQTKLDLNTVRGEVVEGVLAFVWMGTGPVFVLTTIHEIGQNDDHTKGARRKTKITSTSHQKVRSVDGDSIKTLSSAPVGVDDYNYIMGSVNTADQLRGYCNRQLTVRRSWMPLFLWLVDTVIVNCYRIMELRTSGAESNPCAQKDFRIRLIWELVREANLESKEQEVFGLGIPHRHENEVIAEPQKKKRRYVTKNSKLPDLRLLPGKHWPIYKEKRLGCVWCKFNSVKAGCGGSKDPNKSFWYCLECDVALCLNNNRNCFMEYHTESL